MNTNNLIGRMWVSTHLSAVYPHAAVNGGVHQPTLRNSGPLRSVLAESKCVTADVATVAPIFVCVCVCVIRNSPDSCEMLCVWSLPSRCVSRSAIAARQMDADWFSRLASSMLSLRANNEGENTDDDSDDSVSVFRAGHRCPLRGCNSTAIR